MPKSGYFVPGGDDKLTDRAMRRGVYANSPAGSPKFNTGGSRVGPTETQARLYLEIPDQTAYSTARKNTSLSHRARSIFDVMAVYPDENGRYRKGSGYVDFYLSSVGLSLTEQTQISEPLADTSVVYYMGQHTPRLSLQGFVLNTRQNDWADAFFVMYQELMRGTKLAMRSHQAILRIDTRLYYGSIINLSMSFNAGMEVKSDFSFGFVVRRITMRHTSHVLRTPTYGGGNGLGRVAPPDMGRYVGLKRLREEEEFDRIFREYVQNEEARVTREAADLKRVNARGEEKEVLFSGDGSAVGVQVVKDYFLERAILSGDRDAVDARLGPVGGEPVTGIVGPMR